MHWSSGTLAGWAHSPTSSPFQRREMRRILIAIAATALVAGTVVLPGAM